MDLEGIIDTELAPLLGRLGFRLEATGWHGLPAWIWSNGRAELIAIHAAQHCEVSFHLRTEGSGGDERIPLGLFLAHFSDEDADWANCIMGTDPERLASALRRLGTIIERNAPHLAGWDRALAARLLDEQSALASAAGRKIRLDDALRDVDRLWRERRYREFADALAPFQDGLTPAARKKLGFARKQAGLA